MAWLGKIKWIISALLIFFLILATNLIDRDNFKIINESITTIYEDRIVANDLIFELTLLIHRKELAIASSDTDFFKTEDAKVNQEIDKLLAAYDNTKFTSQERKVFKRLQEDLNKKNRIAAAENKNIAAYEAQIERVKDNLYKLAKIQLKEGRNQMLLSKNAFEGIELFTQIEIYILIFIAIVLQIIIFYKPNS